MKSRFAAATPALGQGVSTYAKAPPVSRYVALLGRILLAIGLLAAARAAGAEPLRVVAFGDSLSAGFQLPASAAFPKVLEARLRRDGYDARVINAAVSGDTTQGGLARLAYALAGGADLLILELGANDMLRGLDPAITKQNLEKIISYCEARGVKVLLAGMRSSVNFGAENKARFDAIYPDLARERNLPLYPFFLEGVTGDKAMVLVDGLHPSPAGVERIVAGIAPLVERSLDAIRAERRQGEATP
jgi:acyl-CoA thioesterase-1